MSNPLQAPSDIAREALRTLAQRRIAPTPDRYAEIYCEIAGRQDYSGVLAPRMLEQLAAKLAQGEGPNTTHGRVIAQAVNEGNWEAVRQRLEQLLEESARGPNWAEAIRILLRQWSSRHSGLTDARKREMLEHLLTAFGSDSSKLHPRLMSVLKSWSDVAIQTPGRVEVSQSLPLPSPRDSQQMAVPIGSPQGNPGIAPAPIDIDAQGAARILLADTIQNGLVSRLEHAPDLAAEARKLADLARVATSRKDYEALAVALRKFWYKFEQSGESQDRLIDGLGGLLRLMVRNVGELVADDVWVAGQMTQLGELLTAPLNERSVREAERSFRRVVYRQAGLKLSIDQAKQALKAMLTTFVDRLGTLATNTGRYHERLGVLAKELAQTEDMHRIGEIVTRLSDETREMQTDMVRSHEEVVQARRVAAEHQTRVQALEEQLESVSQLVREDALTRALNRRGLEEAFNAESSRSERNSSPLCMAILDIDDFKHINDRFGHAVGDEALVHLAEITRRSLRPSDVVARYGGEEFVILLPDTGLEDARSVLMRTQRELTRHFFMQDNERVL
ncbi:MAG TPA: diguanylate cyclase, partial [Burkholderiales bacterium]|nr:diguanylate cyclase [Burkholderiales bacterium]